MMVLAMVLVFLLTVGLRLLPMRFAPHGAGVDQWFWRAYIEALQKTREFPPRLPQFKLDKAQWYPPLFPLLVARFPTDVFERHAGRVAIALDVLRLLLLMFAARWLSGQDVVAVAAGVVYGLTPVLTTYNMQLNPRGLGALFLDLTWLCMALALSSDVPWWAAALFGGLVLLTHKMTTQLFIYTACLGAVLLADVRLAGLVPLSLAAAVVLSMGFYRYVLRGHVDILRFWYKNWRWSGSNPILESPLYGEPGYESPGKFYRRGWRASVRRLSFVVGLNPWMPAVLLVGLLAAVQGHEFSLLQALALGWLAITFSFALLTTLVPALRCLGQGYLYGYNGSFPAALAFGLMWPDLDGAWYAWLIGVSTAIASSLALFTFFRGLRGSRTLRVDESLNQVICRLKDLPMGTVMCLPQHWHDVVAYRTGKPVAFGGHGYGFRLLQQAFPRLMIPVKQFIKEQDVAYLVLWPAYVNQRFIDDLPPADIESCGEYRIYRFDRVREAHS